RRAGVSTEAQRALKDAYRTIFVRDDGLLAARLDSIAPGVPEVDRLVAFVRSSKRGVIGIGNMGSADA
ncbi:MAG: hypothetical protein OER88_09470, partial [Planctomycetota bacterium]|nr:hypothetical protein [Planctomycetota bacterium]